VLTVQILTLNNGGTIRACLESVLSLGGRVVVGDLGSEDGTPDVCRDMGAEVSRMDPRGDFSSWRNSLIGDGPNMYLEPWEFLASGHGEIEGLSGASAFYVVQGGVVSKQVRFWRAGRFRNPAFESLETKEEASVHPGIVVASNPAPDRRREQTEACRRWAESCPTSPDPYYYLACSLLAEGKVDEFLGTAGKYMIMSGGRGESSLLMNYYMAKVEASKGMLKRASSRALQCIALRPTFAEFWCLLADMLYARGRYEKAREIYRNAKIIGTRRRADDLFPIEVSKYGHYPSEMERKCSELAFSGFVVAEKAKSEAIDKM
jgi:tetratricopeptide (TPR) repeat protein